MRRSMRLAVVCLAGTSMFRSVSDGERRSKLAVPTLKWAIDMILRGSVLVVFVLMPASGGGAAADPPIPLPKRQEARQHVTPDTPLSEEQVRKTREQIRALRKRVQERADLHQCLRRFTTGLGGSVHRKDKIAAELVMQYLDDWRERKWNRWRNSAERNRPGN